MCYKQKLYLVQFSNSNQLSTVFLTAVVPAVGTLKLLPLTFFCSLSCAIFIFGVRIRPILLRFEPLVQAAPVEEMPARHPANDLTAFVVFQANAAFGVADLNAKPCRVVKSERQIFHSLGGYQFVPEIAGSSFEFLP